MIAEKNRHTARLPQPKSSSSSKQGLDYHRAAIVARDKSKEGRPQRQLLSHQLVISPSSIGRYIATSHLIDISARLMPERTLGEKIASAFDVLSSQFAVRRINSNGAS
jgi:hypothetical protein